MNLSLRARLLLAPVLLVVGAVVTMLGFELPAVRRQVVEREQQTLVRTARAIARDASRTPQEAQALADTLENTIGLRVTLIARDGRVLADSRADAARMENHASRDEVRIALAGSAGVATRRSGTTGVEYVYAAVPVQGGGPVAVVRLAEPLALVRALSASLVRASLLAAGLTLAASLVALLWVAGLIAQRARTLQEAAQRIGRGEAARAPEHPADDLGRLGRVLNDMERELRARLLALKRERDDRERILAHMTDGVALIDGADRLAHVNHRLAQLVGAPRPPEPGTPFAQFARSPELAELIADARAEGRTIERETRLWSPMTRPARASATPLAGEPPAPVLLIVHDLTDAEAVQRLRQDFVANVSHELRTPLTSLRGYAETLLEGGLDDAEHRESFVRIIRDQAIRLQELVEDLLALAELERPDASLRLERFDLRELAAQQVAAYRDAATRSGVSLRLGPGGPVPVEADRVRLGQVLANLLDNAVKYTDHGAVVVTVGAEQGRAWCEVRDSGDGIPAHDLPRVFERFYRVDKARAREKGGTGLGLSIVKHAIALHHGEVTLASRLGEGSEFRFEIPQAPAQKHTRHTS